MRVSASPARSCAQVELARLGGHCASDEDFTVTSRAAASMSRCPTRSDIGETSVTPSLTARFESTSTGRRGEIVL